MPRANRLEGFNGSKVQQFKDKAHSQAPVQAVQIAQPLRSVQAVILDNSCSRVQRFKSSRI
jgi:hypothetical protein